jgi:hypothetical protein
MQAPLCANHTQCACVRNTPASMHVLSMLNTIDHSCEQSRGSTCNATLCSKPNRLLFTPSPHGYQQGGLRLTGSLQTRWPIDEEELEECLGKPPVLAVRACHAHDCTHHRTISWTDSEMSMHLFHLYVLVSSKNHIHTWRLAK